MIGALKALAGVKTATADVAAGTATVLHDSKKIKAPALVKAVNAISHRGQPGAFRATVVPPASSGTKKGERKKVEKKQPPPALTTLSDEAPLKQAFNEQSDKTRLVLLLSPT